MVEQPAKWLQDDWFVGFYVWRTTPWMHESDLIHPVCFLHSALTARIRALGIACKVEPPKKDITLILRFCLYVHCKIYTAAFQQKHASIPSSVIAFSDINFPSTHRSFSSMLSTMRLHRWMKSSCDVGEKQASWGLGSLTVLVFIRIEPKLFDLISATIHSILPLIQNGLGNKKGSILSRGHETVDSFHALRAHLGFDLSYYNAEDPDESKSN